MALPFIVILCLCGVFCLAPLSLYLAWLGTLNRRPRPAILSASWDFAAVLAGLSGFLVFGGGLLVAGLQSNFRYAARGNFQAVQAAWGDEGPVWGIITLIYLLTLAGFIALMVGLRLRSLVVYNIDRDEAELAVSEALAEAGQSATRFGNVWGEGRGLVSIDALTGLRNVTVSVRAADPRLRDELLRGLRKRLALAPAAEAPVGGVFSTASVACFIVMLCSMILVGYFLYLTSR